MAEEGEEERKLWRVAYALPPKKVDSFIKPSLLSHALARGIHLFPIDLHKPLLHQAPFHSLIHKLYSPDWNLQLLDLKSRYPDVVIIDSPAAIERLRSRTSMLDAVAHLSHFPTIGIPAQFILEDSSLSTAPTTIPLKFPVIAKPLEADGSSKSHEMSLVFNSEGLKKIHPPVVLQEFVNHGGVVFKVYVAGNHVRCVKRKSLPDVDADNLGSGEATGVMSFSQISNVNAPHYQQQLKNEGEVDGDEVEMPPSDLVEGLAKGLRRELGLNLFNVDVIRDRRDQENSRYLVIDINYFPGYAKLPGFETMFVDFLCDVLNADKQGDDKYLMISWH